MQVLLIDPRQAKRAPGRPQTDRLDCQWLQRLHAYGLLAGAFRPDAQVCVLRAYLRHRQMLLTYAAHHRHAVTVMLALSFLLWLELRQRHSHPNRGRPRDPFSPSAGSVAAGAAGRASGGSTVAAPPSSPLVGVHKSVHGSLLT